MAVYRYQGRDLQGKRITGQLNAHSQEAVASQLLGQNIIPVLIKKSHKSTGMLHLLLRAGFVKISLDEMVMFFQQMHALTRAGVPITSVLDRLAESTRNLVFSDVLSELAQSVASGVSLSISMRAHQNIFSPLVINTVAAGERSGQLENVFKELAIYLEFESKALKRIKSATRYPIIVLVGISVAMVVVTIVVVPSFAKLFDSVDASLPWVTKMILALSSFMIERGIFLLGSVLLAFIIFRYYIRTPKGRLRWHTWILRVPILGSLIERTLIGRFARLFAIVYHAGLPLTEGMHQVSQAIDNAYVSEHLGFMQQRLNSGDSLTVAASHARLFPPMVLQMLQVGEESGMLEEMLYHVAEFYEQEVDYDLVRLDQLISPLIIVILGVMVLLLALGVFLPMWDIIDVSLKH